MKKKLLSRDVFVASTFSIAFLILAYGVFADGFQGLERFAYDLGVRSRDRVPSDRIAVIAVDDASIRNLGRWPWPRDLHAQMVETLGAAGARLVVSTIFYSEAQDDPALAALDELGKSLERSPLAQQIPPEIKTFGAALDELAGRQPSAAALAQAWHGSSLATQYGPELDALRGQLADTRRRLSADTHLSDEMGRFGRVLLPMSFEIGSPAGRPDEALPDYVRRNQLERIVDRVQARADGLLPFPTLSATVPVPELGSKAIGIGFLNSPVDVDGAVRFEPLVLRHFDEYYPSLALAAAAASLNLGPQDIEVRLGEGVALGERNIGTTSALRMYTHFYRAPDGQSPFPVYSFFDVREGKVQASNFKNKIVLIGATANGIGDTFATPVSAAMPPVLVLAHTISSVLQGDYFSRPEWAGSAEAAVLLLAALYLALVLPRLSPGLGFAVSGALVLLLVGSQFYLLVVQAAWLKLVIPAVMLMLGHLLMTVKKLGLTERLKLSSDAESSESNRMLGLAFQGQGQLDIAFEKFRRVQPVDDKLLDLLYNLGLDFERKRQFHKAESVYQYISSRQRGFRDVEQKQARAHKLSETVILGSGSNTTAGGTLVLGASEVEKPMLGRYQVEKELGKGAMGTVYLGRDPKIGRMVAIKTMALSQEFEADDLEEVKARFFREAETAGRLSHPHIVQIFDAGDEHDLAYIAMEFIKGYDLSRHTKMNNLLPIDEVLRYAADAADALDYAHANGIVHRDVKPANLMLIVDTKTIKVTDFGIARIADSSRTKTGTVLGTPSYMSPEQLSGRHVDGRTDLFSLGVTLYQLLTGALPFQADSMATLMFKIANEPHAPPTVLRPDLPPEIDAVIVRALCKDANHRYARGADFARELRMIIATPVPN